MLKVFIKSMSAGMLIGMVAYCYSVCDNKYAGMLLFSAGLFTICRYSLQLYTGRVGYAIKTSGDSIGRLYCMFMINIFSSYVVGLALGIWHPNQVALNIVTRFDAMSIGEMVINSFGCGVCMFLAVDIWKKYNNVLGIVFFVPVFLASGFLHSIALPAFYGMIGEFMPIKLFSVAIMNGVGAIVTNLIVSEVNEHE